MGEAIMTSARGGIGGSGGKYKLQTRIFTSNGTFVVPGNVKNNTFKVMCYGGGGSSDGYCGGGGGYMNIMELNNLQSSVSIPIIIGAGGFRNISNSSVKGNTGGTTTFGSYVSAIGGTGGAMNNYKNSKGGSGGSGGGGGSILYGANGGDGFQFGGGGAGGDGFDRSRSGVGYWVYNIRQYCGGNGGNFGGGGGTTKSYKFNFHCMFDGYDSSDDPIYSIDYTMENTGSNTLIGLGGKYGGNGGYNNGDSGTEFDIDFLNMQDTSLILSKNSSYGKVGAGNYNNSKIAGGGGGGGYGGIGGSGGNGLIIARAPYSSGNYRMNVGAGGGGGGGGYGANGGNGDAGINSGNGGGGGGGGGYGGKGADASLIRYISQGGGGGGYGPSNYGAGGGGTAINGLNGKSGICIIQYYELQS